MRISIQSFMDSIKHRQSSGSPTLAAVSKPHSPAVKVALVLQSSNHPIAQLTEHTLKTDVTELTDKTDPVEATANVDNVEARDMTLMIENRLPREPRLAPLRYERML